MGAIAALKQNGRTDVQVYSFNATAPAVQAVKDGTMTATLGVDLTSAGKELVDQIPNIVKAGDSLATEIVHSRLDHRDQGERRSDSQGQSAIEPRASPLSWLRPAANFYVRQTTDGRATGRAEGRSISVGLANRFRRPPGFHRFFFERSTILRLFGTYGTIIVLIVMLAAFSIAEPGTFGAVGNFRNILNDMAIGTIVAGGLTVPLVAGDFDLSIGYVASFCGLLLVGLLSFNQLSIPLAALIVVVIGAAIGIINGVIVSKLGVNAFIATLGTGTVVVGLNYAYSGGVPLQLTHSRDFVNVAIGRLSWACRTSS